MRILFLLCTVLCLVAPLNASAQKLTTCEVVVDEYGTTELVPCCDLAPNDDLTANDADCLAVQNKLDKNAIEVLNRAVTRQRLRTLARYLRRNPTTPISAFTIEEPFLSLQWCCDCVPGQTCSATVITDVCSITTDGTCPSGTIRTLCEGGLSDPECVGVD